MKFMVDEMLMRLGRWLRAAGYDTAIAEAGMCDRDIYDQALREGRLLITRDRKMLEFRGAGERVIVLDAGSLDAQARDLARKLGIDWTHRPFSRCLVCNAPLVRGGPESLRRVPANSRNELEAVYRCDACGKIYWDGSHVRRMRRKLAAWKAAHCVPSEGNGGC